SHMSHMSKGIAGQIHEQMKTGRPSSDGGRALEVGKSGRLSWFANITPIPSTNQARGPAASDILPSMTQRPALGSNDPERIRSTLGSSVGRRMPGAMERSDK